MGHTSLFAARPGSRAAIITTAVVFFALLAIVPALRATDLKLPTGVTADEAKRMYTEQVDSAYSINQLTQGRLKEFVITRRQVTSDTAKLNIRVTNTAGIVRSGDLKLSKSGGTWYFENWTHSWQPKGVGPLVEDPDVGVLNTMLAEQSARSATTAKLVDGTYTKVAIGKPRPGYRSTVLPVTFSGKSTSKGEITCVKRAERGRDQWFIVSFAEKK